MVGLGGRVEHTHQPQLSGQCGNGPWPLASGDRRRAAGSGLGGEGGDGGGGALREGTGAGLEAGSWPVGRGRAPLEVEAGRRASGPGGDGGAGAAVRGCGCGMGESPPWVAGSGKAL